MNTDAGRGATEMRRGPAGSPTGRAGRARVGTEAGGGSLRDTGDIRETASGEGLLGIATGTVTAGRALIVPDRGREFSDGRRSGLGVEGRAEVGAGREGSEAGAGLGGELDRMISYMAAGVATMPSGNSSL